MATARNQGHVVEDLFHRSVEKSGGRPRTDFDLTRYAAYLTVMNGDPNMPRVAEGQSYFAIRTREAEVAKPVQELTFAEKTLEVMAGLQELVASQKAENDKQAKQLEAQRPVVARMKNYQANEKSSNKQRFARDICKALREQLGIDALQPDVMVFLSRRLNLFVAGKRSDAGEATAWAEKNFYAETRRKVAENGHNISQGLLTARGYDYAWTRIFAYAEEHGHIKLKEKTSA
jgi:DNA-damage-inducible protein D